jgi:wyosine [tRNA(Phe)-imidazoG37] synthetase (radical SAM superfamily)
LASAFGRSILGRSTLGRDWTVELAPLAPRALTVILDLTNRCNLRCRQCYFSYDSVFHRRPELLTPEAFERIASELFPLAHTVFLSAATEPLMSPHFLEVLRITARFHPLSIKLITNATLLTPEIAEALVEQRVAEVDLSIDGGTAPTYEYFRRGARFEEFLRGVALLAQAKRLQRATAPLLQFNVTLMRRNLAELPRIVELAATLGIERISCRHVVPYDGLEMEAESLSKEPLRANQGLAAMLESARRAGIAIGNYPEYFPIEGRPWTAEGSPTAASSCEPTASQSDQRFEQGPLGNLDGPAKLEFDSDGTLELSGWALDPRGVVRVELRRDAFPDEAPCAGESDGLVPLGTAVLQNATRPDVVAAFPGVPGTDRAGWTFRNLEPDPAWSVGTAMTVRAFAENAAGQRKPIGMPRRIRRVAQEAAAPWLYCKFPFSYVFVTPNGRVFPYPDCQGSDAYGVLSPGVDFASLWHGAVATELRRRIIERDPPEMCQRCPIFINRRVTDPQLFRERNMQWHYRTPMGRIEHPAEDAVDAESCLELRGWSIGHARVTQVDVLRARVAGDPAERVDEAGYVAIGSAEFEDRPRPDLAAISRRMPPGKGPSWRFRIERDALPGPGPFEIVVSAVNEERRRAILGKRIVSFQPRAGSGA